MDKIFNHETLAPIPTNEEEWKHFILEQVKRIQNIVEDNLDSELLREYFSYLEQYIKNGWAKEE